MSNGSKQSLLALKQMVDRQAEDDGLWFVARNANTAYVQRGLRRLHAEIEVAVELLAKSPQP